jgi:hypothetical protein
VKIAIISLLLLILCGVPGEGIAEQPGAPGAERFVLTGLVVWSGEEGMAWVQEPDLTRNEIVAVRIGESVGPWKLTRFLDNGIEMDGPSGKVLIPLYNAGAGGPAVAGGAASGSASAPASRPRTNTPQNDAPRVAAPVAPGAPVAQVPGYVRGSGPAPDAGALGEALNRARAARAQSQHLQSQQLGNAKGQPSEAGPSSQAVRGPSAPSGGVTSSSGGVTSSDGGSNAGSGGTDQVIRFPVGGGKQGFKQLFGQR